MADGIKISEMTEVTSLRSDDLFPIVSEGENKKIKTENLAPALMLSVFPIGAKYVSSVNPSTFFGGTWTSKPLYIDYVRGSTTIRENVYVLDPDVKYVIEWTRTA